MESSWRFSLAIIFVQIAALIAILADCFASTEPPLTPTPPAPVITCVKNTATNSVDCSWTASEAPYGLSRSTSPNFAVGPVTPLVGGLNTPSASDSGTLNNGQTYYYFASDQHDFGGGPAIFSLAPTEGIPGTVVTGTGMNIHETPANNDIYVNDLLAPVTAATATTFSFTVPAGATSGFIMIRDNYGTSNFVPFTVLESSTMLSNIGSIIVDSNRVKFVSDIGTAPTSDQVYKVHTDYSLIQVGALGDPIGFGLDAVDFVYYGNGTNIANNLGTIEKTNAAGDEQFYSITGCSSPLDEAWVFGIGIDQDAAGLPVYVWDGLKKKIRRVPPNTSCNSVDKIGPFTGIVARPQGAVVNNNFTSPRTSNLTISKTPAPRIEEYDMGTVTSVDFWTSPAVPMTRPAQMAPTTPAERLVFTDQTGNRVVMLNQATDKNLVLDWAVTSPRAIGIDTYTPSTSTISDAIVGETMKMKRFPLAFNAVYLQIWVESGAGVTTDEIQRFYAKAKAIFLKCRVNLVLRNITFFTNAALRDLDTVQSSPGPGANLTAEEQSLFAMRATDPRDLNIYFVRDFIDPPTQTRRKSPAGYTVVNDLYSEIDDATESGIVISASIVKDPNNRGEMDMALAHETGHALIYRAVWGSGDEHLDPLGVPYDIRNLMHGGADSWQTDLDSAQCNNLSNNISAIWFRSDP